MQAITPILLLFVALNGCQGPVSVPDRINPPAAGEETDAGSFHEPSSTELASAPQAVTIDGKTLYLTVYLWRDFMPSIGPSDHSLTAALDVTSNSGSFPQDITADIVWIKNEAITWRSEVSVTKGSDGLHARAEDGPEWEVGSSVDVVLRLRKEGDQFLLSRRNAAIESTH